MTFEPRLVTAFGVRKTIRQWSEDPRCSISTNTLHTRLSVAGVDPEDAITRGAGVRESTRYAMDGESKTVKEWLADPRCLVNSSTLRTRLSRGWSVKQAMEAVAEEAAAPVIDNPTPSRTYVNAGMPRACPNLMKFSEPARGPAALYAYSLPSKGQST
jgi:hypothetical protein